VEIVRSTVADGELIIDDRVIKQISDYRNGLDPVRVRDALLNILEVAQKCRQEINIGKTPAAYFQEIGEHFKGDISDTAKQHYRDDYEITIDRNGIPINVLMGPHLDLSSSHRIYWFHDKEAKRFIIGHIGHHLRDASTK
jgi:hypothetical protein